METTFTKESAEILLERGLKEVDGGFSFRRDLRQILPSMFNTDIDDYANQAKLIQCPLLFIKTNKGLADEFASSMLENLRLNPDFVLVHVDGLHHVHINQHHKIHKIVFDFLDERLKGDLKRAHL